jgi:hypothetical protein
MKPVMKNFVADGSTMMSRAPLDGDIVSYLIAYFPNLRGLVDYGLIDMKVHFISRENVAKIFMGEVNLREVCMICLRGPPAWSLKLLTMLPVPASMIRRVKYCEY